MLDRTNSGRSESCALFICLGDSAWRSLRRQDAGGSFWLVLRLACGPLVLLLLVPADAVSTTIVGTSADSAVGSAMRACNASGRCRSTYDGIGLIERQRRAILCPLHGDRRRNQHQGSDHDGECLHWLSLSMRLTVGDYSPTALLRKLVLAELPWALPLGA